MMSADILGVPAVQRPTGHATSLRRAHEAQAGLGLSGEGAKMLPEQVEELGGGCFHESI